MLGHDGDARRQILGELRRLREAIERDRRAQNEPDVRRGNGASHLRLGNPRDVNPGGGHPGLLDESAGVLRLARQDERRRPRVERQHRAHERQHERLEALISLPDRAEVGHHRSIREPQRAPGVVARGVRGHLAHAARDDARGRRGAELHQPVAQRRAHRRDAIHACDRVPQKADRFVVRRPVFLRRLRRVRDPAAQQQLVRPRAPHVEHHGIARPLAKPERPLRRMLAATVVDHGIAAEPPSEQPRVRHGRPIPQAADPGDEADVHVRRARAELGDAAARVAIPPSSHRLHQPRADLRGRIAALRARLDLRVIEHLTRHQRGHELPGGDHVDYLVRPTARRSGARRLIDSRRQRLAHDSPRIAPWTS